MVTTQSRRYSLVSLHLVALTAIAVSTLNCATSESPSEEGDPISADSRIAGGKNDGGTTVAPLPATPQQTPSQQPGPTPSTPPPPPVCKPHCDGKSCGPDGCGGVCGTCPNSSTCNAGGACECDPGTVPDSTFTACVPLGGSCGNVSQYGHCVGDTWVRCDAQAGVVALSCGPSRCKTVPEYNVGSCECGNIDSQQGVCTSARGDASRENVHLYCLDSLNILAADNCVHKTGMESGQCGTWITAFGYQTMCHCGPCSAFISGRCVSSCRANETCKYEPGGSVFRCVEPLPTLPR